MNIHFIKNTILFTLTSLLAFSACSQSKNAGSSAQKSHQKFKNVMIAQAQKGDRIGPCEPSICINFSNTKNIAAGAVLNHYYWSDDGGLTWGKSQLKSSMGVYGDPVLISDWKGGFYYAHLSDPDGKSWRSENHLDRIVVQKSSDGGKTYNDGSNTGVRSPKDQDKHWLVADPKTGALLCTWTEFDKYDSKDTKKDHSRILFSKSEDGGKTWSPGLNISQFEGDCLDDDYTTEGAVPAFGPNGEIYVAWAWNNKIWLDKSLDGGKTWLNEDILVADQPGGWAFDVPGVGRCNGMPILVCDLSNGPNRGCLYVNWSDQRAGDSNTDVFMAKSSDGGKTWSAPMRVNDDNSKKHQFFSWLTIDQTNGHLYTVFYDRRNHPDNNTDVFVAISQDGGKTHKNLKISEKPFLPTDGVFFGDYNHISAHNGVVRPIWTRMDNEVLSVWTAILDFPNPPIKDIDD
jgi:hypothetical protein